MASAPPSLVRFPLQSQPSAAILTTVYTVPSGFAVEIPSAQVCNLSATKPKFRISVAPQGAADALSQYLYYDVPIEAHDSLKFDVGMFLGPGDVLRVYSNNGQVAFTFYRREFSQLGLG